MVNPVLFFLIRSCQKTPSNTGLTNTSRRHKSVLMHIGKTSVKYSVLHFSNVNLMKRSAVIASDLLTCCDIIILCVFGLN